MRIGLPLASVSSNCAKLAKPRSPWKRSDRSVYWALMTTLPRPSAILPPMVRSTLVSSASFSSVCSVMTLKDTPSKSSLSTKFTTPATASDPYTAEAPPVSTSTRSMSAVGMLLMSTEPPWVVGTARVPLMSTRVRLEPRPRRSTVAVPLPGLFEVRSKPGTICGMVLSSCSVFTVAVSSI